MAERIMQYLNEVEEGKTKEEIAGKVGLSQDYTRIILNFLNEDGRTSYLPRNEWKLEGIPTSVISSGVRGLWTKRTEDSEEETGLYIKRLERIRDKMVDVAKEEMRDLANLSEKLKKTGDMLTDDERNLLVKYVDGRADNRWGYIEALKEETFLQP